MDIRIVDGDQCIIEVTFDGYFFFDNNSLCAIISPGGLNGK